MARRGAAAAQYRSLHRVRGADPRSQDRRSGPAARVRTRLLLYRRAGFAKDPRQARRTAEGAKDSDIARIHAPIGLPIGAVSPSEIAVAIMAEIIAQLRLPKEKEQAA